MLRRHFVALPALALPAFAAAPPALSAQISALGHDWDVIDPADWSASPTLLDLKVARPQEGNPRRPIQFALARTEPLSRFTLDVEVRHQSPKGSLIVVYAWRKDGYFNYVHLSDDAPDKVEVHNGVFHCFGGDRVRISRVTGPSAIAGDDWHRLSIHYNAARGLVETKVNGHRLPALRGIDLSLAEGRVGLGSFFNTASFRNLRIRR